MDLSEPTAIEILKKNGVEEVHNGIFVGALTQEELAAKSPEAFENIRYLIEEWDCVYITKAQLKQIKS